MIEKLVKNLRLADTLAPFVTICRDKKTFQIIDRKDQFRHVSRENPHDGRTNSLHTELVFMTETGITYCRWKSIADWIRNRAWCGVHWSWKGDKRMEEYAGKWKGDAYRRA